MDGVGGTIKNKVYREVKSGRLTINAPKEFANAASDLVKKIVSLYLPVDEMLDEPSFVKDAPKIPDTLKVHKVVRSKNRNNIPYFDFYKLSNDIEAFHRQYYGQTSNSIVCGHEEAVEKDDNTCAYCVVPYNDSSDQEWLHCPSCKQWFHETCFDEN